MDTGTGHLRRSGVGLVIAATLLVPAIVVLGAGHHVDAPTPLLLAGTLLAMTLAGAGLRLVGHARSREEAVGHARRMALAAQVLKHDNARLALSNTELEAFAARIAHDLRSPLGSVVTTLRTLTRPDVDLDPAIQRDLLERALATSSRSVELVEALLDHASARGREADAGLVDVATLTREVVDTLPADRVAGARIDLPTSTAAAWGDPRLLHLVLQNLLTNALTHGAPHLTRVRVGVHRGDGQVEVEVADDGVAIPAGRADEVFRVGSGDASSGGLGLGLATCRSVVARHGGRIWVAPSDLGGTAVRFTLPWPDTASTEVADLAQRRRATTSSSGSSMRTPVAS